MFFQLDTPSNASFPDPALAETEPNGLLAIGGDLTVERLVNAYKNGIFPWYSVGDPILWWSPDPRLILKPKDLHISRSLQKLIRQQKFEISLNQCFEKVIQACSEPRQGESGTWITEEIKAAYISLHQAGFALSVEIWQNKELVGGLYGVELKGAFFGESMFSRVSNSSKIALVTLAEYALEKQIQLIDCQMTTAHLLSMGAKEMPRATFLDQLQQVTSL
jgi:leucyl/phenylalanyl-tRNA--protein transferase